MIFRRSPKSRGANFGTFSQMRQILPLFNCDWLQLCSGKTEINHFFGCFLPKRLSLAAMGGNYLSHIIIVVSLYTTGWGVKEVPQNDNREFSSIVLSTFRIIVPFLPPRDCRLFALIVYNGKFWFIYSRIASHHIRSRHFFHVNGVCPDSGGIN